MRSAKRRNEAAIRAPDGDGDAADEADGAGKAYSALLTLLGGSVPKPKRARAAKPAPAPTALENANAAEIEGAAAGEEEDEDVAESDEEADAGSDTGDAAVAALDDNEGDARDPFEWHFAAADADELTPPASWASTPVPLAILGERSVLQAPSPAAGLPARAAPAAKSAAALKLKHRLRAPFSRANSEFTKSDSANALTPLQRELAPPLFAYQDLLIANRAWDTAAEARTLWTLHALNHIYKTRDRVIKNTYKLGRGDADKPDEDEEDAAKDQGFTRPKVLVLLPTRNAAVDFIETLGAVSGLAQIENKKRFLDAFRAPSEGLENKPDDFQQAFAGNANDLFCLGIKFTRQAVKLYSSFYSSDLIIGSPLGLRMVIGAEGDAKHDADFLSSIELVVADQVEAMLMQSWDNVHHVFAHLNKMPRQSHGCDFSRIRPWYLDDKARLLRQTVLISEYATPEMHSLFARQCHNVGGKLKARPIAPGIMAELGVHLRQVFTRLPAASFRQDADERFSHFTKATLPGLLRGASSQGTLVVVPSYFDFVRVRNYLEKRDDVAYVSLSEYSPAAHVSRGRSFFTDGRAQIMLYSQRLHHFRRYSIKGVRTVVFYGLPDNPRFYQEIVRFLARTVVEQNVDPDMLKVVAAYSKWDTLKLERIVGTSRVGQLVEGSNDTYEFY